jgi:serine protease Do
MRTSILPPLVAALWCLGAAPVAWGAKSTLPRGVTLPKDVKVPNDTALAIYLPARDLGFKFYVSVAGAWANPGKSLADARQAVGTQFFPSMQAVNTRSGGGFDPGRYGLLLALGPKWDSKAGQLTLTLNYRVFDPTGAKLLEGSQSYGAPFNAGGAMGGFPNTALHATQLVMVDVLRRLKPDAQKFPATGDIGQIDPEKLIDRSEAKTTGTAFFINKAGQMMTAAHVLQDCLVIEAQQDGVTIPVKLAASSDLLDLAVVDSGKPTDHALPLRKGETLTLGEAVTNVGFPLQGLLAASPNLTRGNVSARAGLKGSVGLFQFSAPIQPGSSGGPVVSDGGELLGITVSSLNAAALIKEGLLPQNVNFALEARYAAMFLRDSKIAFTEIDPRSGGMTVANDAALGAVLQLSCYQ